MLQVHVLCDAAYLCRSGFPPILSLACELWSCTCCNHWNKRQNWKLRNRKTAAVLVLTYRFVYFSAVYMWLKSSQLKSRLRMTFSCHQTSGMYYARPLTREGKTKHKQTKIFHDIKHIVTDKWKVVGRNNNNNKKKTAEKTKHYVSLQTGNPYWMCNHNSNYKPPDS